MNEKFLIYSLKGKRIEVSIPERMGGYSLKGTVTNVERDVLNNKIIIKINNKMYAFKEPKEIQSEKNSIIFIYGDINKSNIDDKEIFNQIRNGSYLDSVIRSNVCDDIFSISFNILNPVENKAVGKISAKKKNKIRKKKK